MSNVTAKVNGVELTEAQVADAMRQIEQAKRANDRHIRTHRYASCIYIPVAVARELSAAANRAATGYVLLTPAGRVDVLGDRVDDSFGFWGGPR